MLIKIAQGLLLLAVFGFLHCSKGSGPFERDNLLDPEGTNWHPPMVIAMDDSLIAVGDSITIRASGSDPNGTVMEYLWALDGFSYKNKTDSGEITIAFQTAGIKTVLVKVLDNDSIESETDSIIIIVMGDAPINVSPVNGVLSQTARPTLRWIPGKFNSSFTVLLDTVNPPVSVKKTGVTDSSFADTTRDLKYGKTYYWRIIGVDPFSQTAPGEVWQFNTPLTSGMKLISAAGHVFSMGQNTTAMPVHSVQFTYDFFMDSSEVTQEDFFRIMGTNPSSFSETSNLPVEYVTWFDAVLYCNKKSELEGKDTVYVYTWISGTPGNGCSGLTGLSIDMSKDGYRLPTEAEWEYACRANTATEYYWGNGASNAYAWYSSNTATIQPVATRLPNAFGLYDMAGNVREWCNDWYTSYSNNMVYDPVGPAYGTYRVLRGGAYDDPFINTFASAYRTNDYPYTRSTSTGFRAVLSLSVSTPVIIYQPQSQTVDIGQTVTFSVWANGYPPPACQWQKNGIDISGATFANYIIASALPSDSGVYTVVVSNSRERVKSDSAVLTVIDTTTIKYVTTDSMVSISGAMFPMGSDLNADEQPIHTVSISGFFMSNTEVTQGEYVRVMGVNPSYFASDTNQPVENLTWFDAVLYCNKRSVLEGRDSVYSYIGISGIPGNGCTGLTGLAITMTNNGYRLPTEAKWEFACRAGSVDDFLWGSYPPNSIQDTTLIDSNAWWANNSGNISHAVAQKRYNGFELYDMTGNVQEWCNDWYDAYGSGMEYDPIGPMSGTSRITRGGSWTSNGIDLRCAARIYLPPVRVNWLGFRVVSR